MDKKAISYEASHRTSGQSLKSSIQYKESNPEQKETPVGYTAAPSRLQLTRFMSLHSGIQVGDLLWNWKDLSKINFARLDKSELFIGCPSTRCLKTSLQGEQNFMPSKLHFKSEEDLLEEEFPEHVAPIMNADRLWGSFYVFPDLYEDVYSPVVRVKTMDGEHNVESKNLGVLTKDLVAIHLTYLKRTPILGDFVFIKLDLSSMRLQDISVLKNYKYLVYLDLSQNLVKDLRVLSYLPYLQHVDVSNNHLDSVLEYDTPQWFLTEVHYKYNFVNIIRNLTDLWSITVLDLSHNSIKCISGLNELHYLRHLDLSFNHIKRLENLNHLRIVWLDLSYNNITSFEHDCDTGLWTLQHLEYLNINDNNVMSMKIFDKCTRLRELHARNNRFTAILELAIYMRQLRRVRILDMRANSVCSSPGYKEVVLTVFPALLNLDGEDLDPVDVRSTKMNMTPDIVTFATRRLLRLLYIEQLSRARLSPFVPLADSTEVPIVVLVGYEGVGKGSLAQRLAKECNSHVELALQHTTSSFSEGNQYHQITRDKFDQMLLAGDFLTYTEINSESYGLSKKEAFVGNGKVRIVTMDMISALMLKLRGRNPYLILVNCAEKALILERQKIRKIAQTVEAERLLESTTLFIDQKSNLRAMLSGRFIINGILNEILLQIPEDKKCSEFTLDTECSLEVDPHRREGTDGKSMDSSIVSVYEPTSTAERISTTNTNDTSLFSLYSHRDTTSANFTDSFIRCVPGQDHKRSEPLIKYPSKIVEFDKPNDPKISIGDPRQSSKLSKSVGFIPSKSDQYDNQATCSTEGLLVEPMVPPDSKDKADMLNSVSEKFLGREQEYGASPSLEDLELWFSFLQENGLLKISEIKDYYSKSAVHLVSSSKDNAILQELKNYDAKNRDSDYETDEPIRASALRNFLSRRTASGNTLQSNPSATGEYYVELRVFYTKELEAVASESTRWKKAFITFKGAIDDTSPIFKSVSDVVTAAKKEYKGIQPVLYP